MANKCPKCGYIRSTTDITPEYECPRCGVIYEKFINRTNQNMHPKKRSKNNKVFFWAGLATLSVIIGIYLYNVIVITNRDSASTNHIITWDTPLPPIFNSRQISSLANVHTATFSTDNKYLVTATSYAPKKNLLEFHLINIADGKILNSWEFKPKNNICSIHVNSMSYDENGSRLYVGTNGYINESAKPCKNNNSESSSYKSVLVWGMPDGNYIKSIPIQSTSEQVNNFILSKNAKYAAIKTSNNALLLSLDTGTLTRLISDASYLIALAFSSDEKYIAASTAEDGIVIWRTDDGELYKAILRQNIDIIKSEDKYIQHIDYYPENNALLLGIKNGTIIHITFDRKTNEQHGWRAECDVTDSWNSLIYDTLKANKILGVTYSPDVELAAFGCDDVVMIIDNSTKEVHKRWEIDNNAFKESKMIFSPDSRYLANINDGKLTILNVEKGVALLESMIRDRLNEAYIIYRTMPPELQQQAIKILMGEKVPYKSSDLAKNEFESTNDYNKRIAEAEKSYNKRVKDYNQTIIETQKRIDQHYSSHEYLPANNVHEIANKVLNEALGEPVLRDIKYNADTEYFHFNIASTSNEMEGFVLRYMLSKKIPNSSAREMKELLEGSNLHLVVTFSLANGSLAQPSTAHININNKSYKAVLNQAVDDSMSINLEMPKYNKREINLLNKIITE